MIIPIEIVLPFTNKLFLLLVYHPQRYNTTLDNKCLRGQCSHLCLLVPGGHHCACPDNTTPISHRSTLEVVCDARKSSIVMKLNNA